MFVVKIRGVDASSHSRLVDAETQKQIFMALSSDPESDLEIVEQDTFEPE